MNQEQDVFSLLTMLCVRRVEDFTDNVYVQGESVRDHVQCKHREINENMN